MDLKREVWRVREIESEKGDSAEGKGVGPILKRSLPCEVWRSGGQRPPEP